MAGPWQAYQIDESKATPREREGEASAVKAEAAAAVAPELTRAQLKSVQLQTQETEAKLRDREEKKAAEEKGKAAVEAKARMDKEMLLGLLTNIQQAKDAVSRTGATGIAAQITGGLFGSPAKELQGSLSPIKSKVVLDALQRARVGSAVGATGFGALQIRELALLENALGSLSEDQPPEAILRTLENIDRLTRRQLSFGAGYDPDTPEGAALFKLPMPQGSEDLPLPSGGDIKSGRWDKRPELAGLDAAVTSMIKAGRSADQIRQYLNEYQPGLGDKTDNLEVNIDFWKETGRDPQVTIERYFVPEEAGVTEAITDNPVGAGAQAAANQLSMGVTGLIPGEEGQRIRAVQRGLAEKYPVATGIGNVAGGIGSALTGTAAAGRLGFKLPGLLEGTVQEGFRGAFMAEPGERIGGGIEGSLTALGGNVLMRPLSSLAGNVLRGATPDAATLSQRYGITLSPGQLSGVDEGTLAGLPLVGGQVQARRNESLVDFNRAAFRDALAPIGTDVGAVGQEGVALAQQAVSDAYRQALGGVNVVIDAPILQTIRGKPYAELASLPDVGAELTQSVDDIFAKYADVQNGVISGENLQNALQEIQQLKNAYKQDPRWSRRIAPALDDISDGYLDALERQAPDNFKMFTDANTAYRNLSVLEGAVLKAPDGDIFGPGNLRAATNQATNRFGGRKAAARGDKPFNDLIQAATGVIPAKADDVSLAGRLFPVGAGAGAGIGGMSLLSAPSDDTTGQQEGPSYLPPGVLAAALGAGLASLPYGRGGTRLANSLLGGQRTANQKTLGELVYNYLTPAARGAVVGATTEPGTPSPQEEVSPDIIVTPEMRAAVLGTAAPSPPGDSEINLGGFQPQYEEAEPTGDAVQTTQIIDGRVTDIDQVTGRRVFVDTGEPVEGFAKGGAVSFAERQRGQQERQAESSRRAQQQLAAARDQRTAQARERLAATSPMNRRAAMARAQERPKTSHLTDLTMAARRRGNDLVVGLADLMDHYGLSPANAVAWAAENIEGRSPQEVARLRQNLSGLGSNRELVEAGAMSNERRFRQAGGLGAREYDEEALPVDWSAMGYRLGAIPSAVQSEAPRAAQAVGNYFANSTPQSLMADVGRAAQSGVEAFRRDPYGSVFEGAFYRAFPITAAAGDFAAMREGSKLLGQYAREDPLAARDQQFIDALSVLPLITPLGMRGAKQGARRRTR